MTRRHEYLSQAAVGRLAGVIRRTVAVWRTRHPDFPNATRCPTCDHGPVFERAAVERWLSTTGRKMT